MLKFVDTPVEKLYYRSEFIDVMQEERVSEARGSTVGAALIVAGTCIGAGMLAMPVATGPSGLLPSLTVNGLSWIYLVITGLLFAEVTLLMPLGSNVLSISKQYLGRTGEWLAGAAFVFLYCCLLVAYVAGGIPAFGQVLAALGITLSNGLLTLLFVLLFGALVWFGTATVDRVNWLLMAGLLISYFLLVVIGGDEVLLTNLQSTWWHRAWPAVPVLFSAYGFHNVVPTLAAYLGGDRRRLMRALIGGMCIPLVVYSVWQWLLIGAVSGEGLELAQELGIPITNILVDFTESAWVGQIGLFFGFFALVTSFLGVSLSVIDFLGDGFGITERSGWRRLGLCIIALGIPTLLAMERPHLFSHALGVAGGFGEALLNGLFPVAVYWVAMRSMGRQVARGWLVLLGLIAVAVMVLEGYLLMTH